MNNFECIGGPYDGKQMACRCDPQDGLRESVFLWNGEQTREAFYELRRHETVELITGAGVWQWHFVDA